MLRGEVVEGSLEDRISCVVISMVTNWQASTTG